MTDAPTASDSREVAKAFGYKQCEWFRKRKLAEESDSPDDLDKIATHVGRR